VSVIGKEAVSFASNREIKLPKFSWAWVSLPSLIAVWEMLSWMFPSYIFPGPWDTFIEGEEWVTSSEIFTHVWASFLEEVGGFGAAIVVSLICGFSAGFFKEFREFMVPLNGIFMAIPPIAWAPLMLIIFGIGYTTFVVVIFISAVNPMILSIMDGVMTIQGNEVRAARALGAKKTQLFWYVYLPASLPFITSGLRVGFSQAWRALVAAEMIGATAGVGWMVSQGGEIGNAKQVMLGIVLIGSISLLFERAVFRQLEKHYEVWRLK